MGFNSLLPLPIISTIFGVLKSLDLRTVGMELGDVPPEFGWVLVLFEPNLEPTVSEGVLEPSKGQTVSEGVLEPSKIQTVSEGVLDVEAAQSGPEPGPEPGKPKRGLRLFSLTDWMTPSLIWIGWKILRRLTVMGLI